MNVASIMRSRYLLPLITAGLFVVLLVVALANIFYQSKQAIVQTILKDVDQLEEIFERIDKECGILGFDYQKNPINFLNVEQFLGSELGPMNLEHPERWQGPYLDDNPSVQGIEYQIVRTKQGYFITPGDGVELPNGKVIGKDIALDEGTDINALMLHEDGLLYKGNQLAKKLILAVEADIPLSSQLLAIGEE